MYYCDFSIYPLQIQVRLFQNPYCLFSISMITPKYTYTVIISCIFILSIVILLLAYTLEICFIHVDINRIADTRCILHCMTTTFYNFELFITVLCFTGLINTYWFLKYILHGFCISHHHTI